MKSRRNIFKKWLTHARMGAGIFLDRVILKYDDGEVK